MWQHFGVLAGHLFGVLNALVSNKQGGLVIFLEQWSLSLQTCTNMSVFPKVMYVTHAQSSAYENKKYPQHISSKISLALSIDTQLLTVRNRNNTITN